jgi:hypothetical protein
MPFNDTNIYHVSMILTSKLPRSNNQAWNKRKMFDGFHTLMKDHLKVPESRRTGKNVKCNVAQIFCDAKKLYNIGCPLFEYLFEYFFGKLFIIRIFFDRIFE